MQLIAFLAALILIGLAAALNGCVLALLLVRSFRGLAPRRPRKLAALQRPAVLSPR